MSVEGPVGDNGGNSPRPDRDALDVSDEPEPRPTGLPPRAAPPPPPGAASTPPPAPPAARTLPGVPPPPAGRPRGDARPPAPPRRGSVASRDDRQRWLVAGAAVGVLVVALLGVALVRTLAGGDGDDGATPTGPLAAVVPNVAASPVVLGPADQNALLTELLATGRHDAATATPAGMLCAAAALDAPLEVVGRWERDGQEVAVSDPSPVGAPGFGDCLDDGGDRLADGAYQFLVADLDGQESAAATLVVGAAPLTQVFVNDGDEPICAVRIAPSSAGYFEAYDLTARPLAPGATMALVIADVEQAVRTSACGEDAAALTSFEFDPDPAVTRPLGP